MKGFIFTVGDQGDSVKVVTDDGGLPVTHSEYLPYGELLAQEGNECNREQFNSQAKDKESGFYFYNARHYDGAIARFVTADSVVDGEDSLAGWNRYAYCGGNPVGYRDPSGHWSDQSETHYVKDIDNNTHSINVCRGTVTNGDNLWKIAKETLKKEIKYKLIKDKISNKAIQKKVNLIKKLGHSGMLGNMYISNHIKYKNINSWCNLN